MLPNILSLPLLTATVLVASGCATIQHPGDFFEASGPTAAQLERIPVHLFMSSKEGGTAVHLGNNHLLTCKHLLTGPVVEIDRVLTGYTIIASGQDETSKDDWVVIRVLNVSIQSPSILDDWEPHHRLKDGQSVWIIGFWAEGRTDLTPAEVRQLKKTFVKAQVKHPPTSLSKNLIYLVAPASDTYRGLSGAPVMVWDPEKERMNFLGIYTGTEEYSFLVWYDVRHVVRKFNSTMAPGLQ